MLQISLRRLAGARYTDLLAASQDGEGFFKRVSDWLTLVSVERKHQKQG